MKNYNQKSMEEIKMMFTPLTKELLKQFVLRKYEESADTSDYSLEIELMWLYHNNQLSELFICEHIYSEERLKHALPYSAL
jgi:hypothetical protein